MQCLNTNNRQNQNFTVPWLYVYADLSQGGNLVPTMTGCVSKSEGHGSFSGFTQYVYELMLSIVYYYNRKVVRMSYNKHKLYHMVKKGEGLWITFVSAFIEIALGFLGGE